VGVRVELAVQGSLDPPVTAHDVADAAGDAQNRPPHAVGSEYLPVGVAHHRIRELERGAKALARLLRVVGDADDLEAGLLEDRVLAAEPAGLTGSARGEGLGEEEHDRAAFTQDSV
jgi:hypothetical protein